MRVAQRTRLAVCATFAVVIPFTPGIGIGMRVALSAVVLAYALLALVAEVFDDRRGTNHSRLVNPMLGVATVLIVVLGWPSLFVVGVLFLSLIVAFHTCLSGLRVGLLTACVSIAVVIAVEATAPTADDLGLFTVVMIAVMLPSLVVIVAGLTGERRQTAEQLMRLHEALRAVRASADLGATLESVAQSIADAVDAEIAGVLLQESDYFALSAKGVLRESMSTEQVDDFTRRDLALGVRGPLGYSMARNESVVLADIDTDERFSPWTTPWAEALRAAGCSSVVVVPLHLGAEVIGILAAAFPWEGGLDEDDLTFLEAYAEQASAVIVLARAFERERAVALERAEADRRKSEFLSVVSHELRTPLTAVKGFVDTVLLHWDRLPDEQRRELLGRASTNGDELARLVGQLLDFARIDADRVQIRPALLDVRASIVTVVDDLAPVLVHHEVDVDAPADLRALADADAFEHVLVNLLTNAVKFSPRGTRIRVAGCPVESGGAGREVVVSVSDEGVGIAPADRERIFERFYQAEGNELSRRGTGIGLTIARRFAELQGGRLWLESTPGVGTTFSFSLPAVRSATEAVVRSATEAVGGEAKGAPASPVVVEAGAGLAPEPAVGDQLA